ncbi:hypothetical protein GCM10010116_25010 [Microbispora rosea subsp. aerata]|nr:hypothetical protein GCM10010116_25010 [Microbispora rosea subsp. aerata]GIH54063.1 hypothetical protein Mro02_09770 [Microbispora rosea subsp. aerata]GLJ85036.1 hypothetical protein GCM10017588_37640 [Microbispora rosea subsp. aerata]
MDAPLGHARHIVALLRITQAAPRHAVTLPTSPWEGEFYLLREPAARLQALLDAYAKPPRRVAGWRSPRLPGAAVGNAVIGSSSASRCVHLDPGPRRTAFA